MCMPICASCMCSVPQKLKEGVGSLGTRITDSCEMLCEWWKLTEDMREILRGAVHFETGSYHSFPQGVPELLDGKSITVDFIDWPSGEKIRGLKMFKNGRVDLKFSNGELAGEFAHKYLGTMC